jgi:cyclic pyranopterin phosphate synthase
MELSHIDKNNNPTMVDISNKSISKRSATASCKVVIPEEVIHCFRDGDVKTKKGPVIQTAIIAATMAVKNTSKLIPFCHPIEIEKCNITIDLIDNNFQIQCEVSNSGKTGVEMEALTGANIAALTIYDMCKALSHQMIITECKLEKKTGGKRDVN